ncbi:hypothetical protein MXD62_16655 [Frankia sp. Mgl5]|uniref:hypothetical protein n=1 Tax=Frankia sp. Mgl5 TaxID=2933793 RepID=UPI00200C022B|nr:hypothetical protein [Frankia sp. Mgl5]MCK9928787.1 hypothetical protein [Frankia sp. Mgl5]
MTDQTSHTEHRVSLEFCARDRELALGLLDFANTTARDIATAYPGVETAVSLNEYQVTDVQPLVHAAVVDDVTNRVLAALHQDQQTRQAGTL